MPPFPLPYPSPALVSRIKLVSRSVAFGIRSRTFSLGKSMATGTVCVPLPLPTLHSGPHGKVPQTLSCLPFITCLSPTMWYLVPVPYSPDWASPGRRKMMCWKYLSNVGSWLCRAVERCCLLLGFLALSWGALKLWAELLASLP